MFAEETHIPANSTIAALQEQYWTKIRHPHVGGIELTPFCNLKCVHCYLQDQTKSELLTTSQVQSIIDQLYDAGVLFLYFTGGEIFTRPDFLEIYVYAKKKGFIIELLTNGTLVSDDAVSIFNRYPPASISISMYGACEESYYRVTGKTGMYEKVLNTFHLLHSNGIHFEIKYIGMVENQDDFFSIKAIADRYGAQFSYSMELFPTLQGNGCTKNHMIPLDKIIEIEQKIPGKKEEYAKLSKIANPFRNRKNIPLYLCDMAISNFLVDYQGYLNPCHKCRFKKWNLLSYDFQTAWADYASILQERASEKNKCLKCKYVMMCSPCVQVNHLSTGDFNTPSDTVCQLTHLRVKMANGNT